MVCGGQGVCGIRLPRYFGVIPEPLVQVGVGRVGQSVGVGNRRYVQRERLAHLGRPADGGTSRRRRVWRGCCQVVVVAQDQPCRGRSAVVVAGGDVLEQHPAVDVVGVLRGGDRHGLGSVPVVCGEGKAGGTHRRPTRRMIADGHGDVRRWLGRQRHGVGAALALLDQEVVPAQRQPPSGPVHVGNGGPVGRRLLGEREQTIATEVLEDRFTCLDKEVVVGHGHRLALGDRFRHRQCDRVSGHRGVAANGKSPRPP